MATNTFESAVHITKKACEVFRNNLAFAKTVSTDYKNEYEVPGAKHGATINLRVPGFYDVRTGPASQVQGYNETYRPLTVYQYGVDLAFTSADMKLLVNEGDAFTRNVLEPMIAPLANKIDADGLALYSSIYNAVGTPGTPPSDLQYFLDGAALLDNFATPRSQRYATVSPKTNSKVVYGNRSLFHSGDQISNQYEKGIMDTSAGFKWNVDQNVKAHTTGTVGTSTPLMNGTTADGATQIVTDGWASGGTTLKVGDILTIDNVYALNPVSKAQTTELMQFVVTEQISDTTGGATIKISPSIILTGPTRNVSAVPVNDAKVYYWGKNDNTYSAKTGYSDLLYHRNAFQLVTLDLQTPDSAAWAKRVSDPNLPFKFRMLKWYNGNTDEELLRLDILVGWALLRPQWACRIQG